MSSVLEKIDPPDQRRVILHHAPAQPEWSPLTPQPRHSLLQRSVGDASAQYAGLSLRRRGVRLRVLALRSRRAKPRLCARVVGTTLTQEVEKSGPKRPKRDPV